MFAVTKVMKFNFFHVAAIAWTWCSLANVPSYSSQVSMGSLRMDGQINSAPGPPIRIGTALTITCCSRHHVLGLAIQRGYQLFVEWFNEERGGVLIGGQKRPIELVVIDDFSDKERTKTVTTHLIDSLGIKLLLGPYGSTLTGVAAGVAHSKGAVLVAPASSSSSVFADRPNVYGILTPASMYLKSAFELVVQAGVKTLVYMQEDATFPREVCGGISNFASQHGVSILGSFDVTSDADDSVTEKTVKDMQAIAPDLVVGCVYDDVCRRFLKASQKLGYAPPSAIFTVCVTTPGFIEEVGLAGRFIVGATAWISSLPLTSSVAPGWTAQSFDQKYKERFALRKGEEIPYHAAAAWAAVAALTRSIELAGSLDTGAISAQLRSVNLQTIYGNVAFDSQGQCVNEFKAVQFPIQGTIPNVVAPVSVTAGNEFVFPMPLWAIRKCMVPDAAGSTHGFHEDGLTCDFCPENQAAIWKTMPDGGNYDGWYCAGCPAGQSLYQLTTGGIRKCLEKCLPGSVPKLDGCKECAAGSQSYGAECLPCLVGRFSELPGQTECQTCPLGKFSNQTGAKGCSSCLPGTCASGEGLSSCRSCLPGTFAATSGASDCKLCPSGYVVDKELASECSPCPPGRYSMWGAQACAACPVGSYQDLPYQAGCRECPDGTKCPREGMNRGENLRGFWMWMDERQSVGNLPGSPEWFRCLSSLECLPQEKCLEGQTGLLCRVCLPSFARTTSARTCFKCPHPLPNILITIFLLCFFIVVVWVVAVVTIQSASKVKAVSDVIAKLLLNYLTTATIMSQAVRNILLTKEHLSQQDEEFLLQAFDFLDTDPMERQSSTWALGCIFHASLSDEDRTIISMLEGATHHQAMLDPAFAEARDLLAAFHHATELNRIVMWVMIPGVFIFILFLIGGIFLSVHLWKNRQFYEQARQFYTEVHESGFSQSMIQMPPELWTQYILAHDSRFLGIWKAVKFTRDKSWRQWIRIFFKEGQPLALVAALLMYPRVVRAVIQQLSCSTPVPEVSSHPTLDISYDVECYKSDDPIFWLAIVSALTVGVGWPSLAYLKLTRLRGGQFFDPEARVSLASRSKLFKPVTLRSWGFLYNGYESNRYAWECLVLVRKFTGFVLVGVYVDEGLRMLLLLAAASIFSALHLLYEPFDNRFDCLLDGIERRHMFVWVISCVISLAMYLDVASTNMTLVLLGFALLCLHVAFFIHTFQHLIVHTRTGWADKMMHQARKKEDVHKLHAHCKSVWVEALATNSMLGLRLDHPEGHGHALGYLGHGLFHEMMHPKEMVDDVKSKWKHWLLHRHMRFLQRSPYVCCNAENSWVMILGSGSDVCHSFLVPETVEKPSGCDKPEGVKRASKYHSSHFLRILTECMHYIVVFQEVHTFSGTLLEFIIRAGFTLEKAKPATGKSAGKMLLQEITAKAVQSGYTTEQVEQIQQSQAWQDDADDHNSLCRVTLTESTVKHVVSKMFEPSLFKHGLSLHHFQANLGRVMRASRNELIMWLDAFEVAWRHQNKPQICEPAIVDSINVLTDSEGGTGGTHIDPRKVHPILCDVSIQTESELAKSGEQQNPSEESARQFNSMLGRRQYGEQQNPSEESRSRKVSFAKDTMLTPATMLNDLQSSQAQSSRPTPTRYGNEGEGVVLIDDLAEVAGGDAPRPAIVLDPENTANPAVMVGVDDDGKGCNDWGCACRPSSTP